MKINKLNRRNFIKDASIGSIAAMGTGMITPETAEAIDNSEPMKITKIDAVRFKGGGWVWVRIHTDAGIVGVGETYPDLNAHIGALQDIAPSLIGKDPRDIDRIWQDVFFRIAGWGWGGSDMRILDALNIAQWDILGKASGLPIYRLLGGKTRKKVKIENTYVSSSMNINGWTLEEDTPKIMRFLLDRGITGIKIYPYSAVARLSGDQYGTYISAAEIESCLDYVKRIRDSVGYEMDIGLDLSSRWNLPCALRIAESLEPYRIMWLEDVLLQDNMASYAVLARETSIPICISERLTTNYQFREMLETKAVDIVMYDVCWCGGISEAKRITDMADTYYIPTAPHTWGGPILWLASIHTATATKNLFVMESCYRLYTERFPQYINNVPVPVDGYVTAPESPGLGLEIRPEIFENGSATIIPIT
ncbi:mandelate racemase/muconate lactonizing enzyme family protein [Candidatus Latescibacterota bacterium]